VSSYVKLPADVTSTEKSLGLHFISYFYNPCTTESAVLLHGGYSSKHAEYEGHVRTKVLAHVLNLQL
jgi:hypothetical protein